MNRRRAKNTPKGRRESTLAENAEFADDHFRKLARGRIAAGLKEMGITPPADYTFKITMPPSMRWEEIIRRDLYHRRRGPVPEPETANVLRTEVRRLFENRTADPAHTLSMRKASERFWPHLNPEERYTKYRVTIKDHRKTIEACLNGL